MYEPITSPQEFMQRVRLGSDTPAIEDMHLEFKRKCHYDLDDKHERQKAQREAARDITQFANTEGGTVLYGVNETEDPRTGMVRASGLAPIQNAEKARDWLVGAISRYVYPKTPLASVRILEVDDGRVIAINTTPSIGLQGVWDSAIPTQGMEFLYRNTNKKEQMTMDVVALRMASNGARAMRLRFLEFKEKSDKVTVELHHYQYAPHPTPRHFIQKLAHAVTILDAGQWALLAATVASGVRTDFEIPYDWIESLWVGNDHGARRLNIFVRGHVQVGKGVNLIPYR